MNAYRCEAEFDNGAKVEEKVVIVFAENIGQVRFIVVDILCKSTDDCVTHLEIKKIDIVNGDAFVVTDELKGGAK